MVRTVALDARTGHDDLARLVFINEASTNTRVGLRHTLIGS